MQILLHIVQALFFLMGFGCFNAFIQSKNIGVLLAFVVLSAASAGSFTMNSWWPLLGGFIALWALKIFGLDPSSV